MFRFFFLLVFKPHDAKSLTNDLLMRYTTDAEPRTDVYILLLNVLLLDVNHEFSLKKHIDSTVPLAAT